MLSAFYSNLSCCFSPKEFHHFARSQSTCDRREQILPGVTSRKPKCLQANGGPLTQANGTHAAYANLNLASVSESDFNFEHIYDHIDGDSDDENVYI